MAGNGAQPRARSGSGTVLALRRVVPQAPRETIGWALDRLEAAIARLNDGPAERRVRDQFHQLLLAFERDNVNADLHRLSLALTLENLAPRH